MGKLQQISSNSSNSNKISLMSKMTTNSRNNRSRLKSVSLIRSMRISKVVMGITLHLSITKSDNRYNGSNETRNREMVARLLAPVVNQDLKSAVAKSSFQHLSSRITLLQGIPTPPTNNRIRTAMVESKVRA
mgnify:CR=1 FL=1